MGLAPADLSAREGLRFSGLVLLETGLTNGRIAGMLGVSSSTTAAWRRRFAEGPELWDAPRSGRRRTYGKEVEERFIAFYCQTSPLSDCGCGRWSLRIAAHRLCVDPGRVGARLSRSTMQRMLARHALKPHLTRYFLQITDPDFFPKMERLIGLYRSSTPHVYCFDECPGIQVLRRLAPDARPGDSESARRWISEFEYVRNGTLDVFAFLAVRTGQVAAECHGDHTKATFLAVFRRHVAACPEGVTLHYVMDNLDSHCCYEFCRTVAELSGVACPPAAELGGPDGRREWLGRAGRRIVVHFTPFHGSWLNMVEIWFRIMGRMVLRDSYNGPAQLRDAVLEYAGLWNADWAHPFTWSWDGAGLQRKAVIRFSGMLRRSAGELTLQLLTKQCRLMVNLIRDCWHDIEPELWRELFEAAGAAENDLRRTIAGSARPVVGKNAAEAMDLFMRTIHGKVARSAASAP